MGQEPSRLPVVSVCVPVYNAVATIGPCLSSVLDQGLPETEILVVDNCSTDGTVAQIDAALAGVPAARLVVHSENLGRIQNWNRCLNLPRGQYIKFVMASDVLLRGSLTCLLEAAARHPDTVIVASQHEAWDGQPGRIRRVTPSPRTESWHGTQTLEHVRDGGNPFWALNGALLLRGPIRATGLEFDVSEPYFADLLFCARLAAHGTTTFVHTPTYRFNRSVRTRFHYAGGAPDAFFRGMRRYYDLVNRLLAEGALPTGSPLPRLYDGLCYRLFDEKSGATLAAIHAVFRESPRYEARALLAWLRWRLRLQGAEARSRRMARRIRTWLRS